MSPPSLSCSATIRVWTAGSRDNVVIPSLTHLLSPEASSDHCSGVIPGVTQLIVSLTMVWRGCHHNTWPRMLWYQYRHIGLMMTLIVMVTTQMMFLNCQMMTKDWMWKMMRQSVLLLILLLSIVTRSFGLRIKDFLDRQDNPQSPDRDGKIKVKPKTISAIFFYFTVFHPTVIYRSRSKRSAGSHEKVPVEVRFSALGRKFHFELEPAYQPFSKMSHVLIRR